MNVATLGGVMPNFDKTLTPEELAAAEPVLRRRSRVRAASGRES